MAQIRLNKPCQYLLIILLFCFALVLLTSLRIYSDGLQSQQKFLTITNEDGENEAQDDGTMAKYNNPITKSNNLEKVVFIKKSDCDIIHIAMVCAGFDSNRGLYVLLKSILFHRKDPIHLHLMVDKESQFILAKLFETSRFPGLNVTFYNATQYESDISWIPNRHYSRQFGLLKLVFLSKLANENENLAGLILLDTDMLALGNIRLIWNELMRMINARRTCFGCRAPIFGMVENQSDWYLLGSSDNRIVWPAKGKGFNTGLILVDLEELLHHDWPTLWRQTAERFLISHLATSLADQDIFNAIIWQQNHLVHELAPNYNIQLNDRSKIDDRYLYDTDIQLLHWNSPYKLNTKNPLSKLYNIWYKTFVDWNGALLPESQCILKYPRVFNDENENKQQNGNQFQNVTSCNGIKPGPNQKLRSFLYFLDFNHDPSPYDVTLTVHLSLDRLLALDQLAGNWLGPISVAIYMAEVETSLLVSSIKNSFNLAGRTNIGYHLVFRDEGFNYPINKLRNVALKNALTDYVLIIDIDFLPSLNLYEYLKSVLSEMSNRGIEDHDRDILQDTALVIPAFETLQYKFQFPNNKAELINQLNLGSITTFRAQIWPKGHSPTDFSRWKVATKPYRVDWKPDYEPFVVTNREALRFDERFVGFGWNKVESIMELAASGYQFIVLPEPFLVHKIHSESYDILNHRLSIKYRLCITHLKRTFQNELSMRYPDFSKNISYSEWTR